MTFNIKNIEKSIDEILPKIIEIRHHLHKNPELSLEEFKTAEFVRSHLAELDIEVLPPFLSTDVVALLNGENTKQNITLRADMDALPIIEKNDIPYYSNNDGVMHACGHDGHTAILVGAAIVLEQFKNVLNGSVRFVFQPGEEVVAAGRDLIKSGILKKPRPNAVIALHGWPGYPTGSICSRSGTLMAGADFFKVVLKGAGGHGSESTQTNNPVVVGSKVVEKLTLLSTHKTFSDKVVVSVSKFIGGTNSNVLPTEVILEGSVRYLNKTAGIIIPEIFKNIVHDICDKTEIEFELNYQRPYIPTVNNSAIIANCKKYVHEFIGSDFWIDIEKPVMSSEDFSYYIDKYPGGMFFLGMGEGFPSLHTNNYNFNDNAIKNGILFLVLSTLSLLSDEIK